MAEAPTYVGRAELAYAERTSLEIAKAALEAAGFKAGDVLTIRPFLERTGKKLSCSLTGGEAAEQKETAGFRAAVFYTVWDGTSAVVVTWQESTKTGCTVAVDGWRSANSSMPIDVAGVWATFASTKNPVASSVTTVTVNAVQVIWVIDSVGRTLAKAPTGFTQRGSYVLTRTRAETGATGTTELELTGTGDGLVVNLAIRPVGGKALALELSDSVGFSETYAKRDTKVFSDPVATSDSLTKRVGKTVTDSVATSDSLVKRTGKVLSDSLSTSDSFAKSVAKVVKDSISVAEEWLTSLVKAPVVEGPNAIRVVERPPMRMRMLATTPSGRTYRWGEDSANPDQVFEDLSHSDSANGGYKNLTCSLARDPRVDYHDMERGARIELFGAGQMKVGEYRLERAPLVAGDKLVISPAAVGYEAALTDDSSAQEIYIDADISPWGEPSARRRALEGTKGWKLNQNAQVQLVPAGTPDPANPSNSSIVPAISHSWSQIETSGESTRDTAESWYNSGGVQLGQIILDFLNVKGLTPGDANWSNLVAANANDKGEGYELLVDFNATSQTAWVLAIGAGRYSVSLEDFYAGLKNESGNWETQWRNMRVFGRHGLPLYGTWPNLGVLLSDVAANALSRWAPSIHFTTGPYGTIKPTQFVIPHLAPKEPTTVADIIQQGARYELPEYGVWDDQTFYMNPRGQREGRKRWRVRARDVQLEDTGQQLDRVFNGVIVQGQATDGSTIYIAPAGSGMQVTSPRLLDTDPLNPANQAGIKRYAKIQMKGVCTYEGMLEAGEAFLEQSKLLDASGKATITGYVEDEHGREWPYYCVKGGDEIEVIGSSIPGYRYAVNADKSRSGRSAGIDIDAPPDSYEALMERLNAEFIGLGLAA